MKKEVDIFTPADRLENVQFSAIRQVLDKAAALRAQGREVIALSAGEPNFNTPEPIKNATIKAIQENFTHYGSNRGLLRLREIMAQRIQEKDGVKYDPATEIIFTTGGAEALNNVIMATVNPQDEVIVFSPAFVTYKNLIHLCGAECVELPLLPENDFQPDLDDLKKVITTHTKMLIMNNPNNPTGAVYSYETLKGICELAVKNNFLVLSDEMYRSLVYEGEFTSVASFPGMKERAIIVNGFSKTYAMTGWRLGYIQADVKLTPAIMKVHQYSSTCSPTFIQVGMAEAVKQEETQAEVQAMVEEFARRREILISCLDFIPQIHYIRPKGAFYVMIDISKTGMNGEAFAKRLLEEKNVAVVPAVSMGKGKVYDDFIRVSFAASEEAIREGILRMGEMIRELCLEH